MASRASGIIVVALLLAGAPRVSTAALRAHAMARTSLHAFAVNGTALVSDASAQGPSRAAAATSAGAPGSCRVPAGMLKVRTGLAGVEMVVRSEENHISRDGDKKGWGKFRNVSDMAKEMGVTLPRRGVFLDVGANVGYYSLLFAQAGWSVIAVEPMTQNRQALEATLCLNPALKPLVTVVSAAMGTERDAKQGTCTVRSHDATHAGDGVLECGRAAVPCGKTDGDANVLCEDVLMKTMDAVLAELRPPSVDVVRVDVEGSECGVFEGGASLFKKYHPRALKVENASRATSGCVNRLAEKYGYESNAAR